MSHHDLDYRVDHNVARHEHLPPIRLVVAGGAFELRDYLTSDEAAALGARLSAMALKHQTIGRRIARKWGEDLSTTHVVLDDDVPA